MTVENRPAFRKSLTIACAVAATCLGVSMTSGASAAGNTTPQPSQQSAKHFSAQELDSFAVAYLDIMKIRKEYTPKVSGAAKPEDKQAMEKEAVQKMGKAVQDSGITVKKYNEITTAARSDPDLRKQVSQIIAKKQVK